MKKRILPAALVLAMCLCALSFPSFAAEAKTTAKAVYKDGVVSVTGTGYTAETDYIARVVDTANKSLTAMTQAKAGSDGKLSVNVTTGTLTAVSNYKAYVNTLDGTNVAEAAVTGSGSDSGSDSGSNSGSNSGSSSHHSNNSSGSSSSSGKSSASSSTPSSSGAASTSFSSDTTGDFSVKGSYQFKITSKDGKSPVFTVGTPGVFKVELASSSGNDYYFKLIAIGAPGAQAGIYVNGQKLLVATVGAQASDGGVKSDTTAPFKVKAGKDYTFKLTAKSKPSFVCGNGSVFTVTFAGQKGSDYFFKAKAVGKAGSCAGFYINGSKTPCTTATVA